MILLIPCPPDVYRDYCRMHSVYYWNYFRQLYRRASAEQAFVRTGLGGKSGNERWRNRDADLS